MGRELGEDVAEIEGWADALEAALPEIWNAEMGIWDARDLRTGRFAGILGSGAFLACLVGEAAMRPELDAEMERVWGRVRFGLPSADPEASIFEPRRYWRGPTWPVVNSLIALGLRDMGRPHLAEKLRLETEALIRNGSFYEYFDPLDGTPCGGADFTWTAAIWLTWARGADGEAG